MVGQQPDRLEWQRPQQATTPDGSGDGCLQLRLGGILSREIHRGLLGASGESTPYQRTGVVGSLFWSQSVCKTQKRDKHSTVVEQSDSSVSYQQNGRHQVTHSSGPYKNSVAMVPRAQNFVGSTTHSGKGQFQSKLLVMTSQRQDRLDSESGGLQCHQPAMGTSRGGPVCQQVFCTTATFLQLATIPRAEATDAFAQDWSAKRGYAHPPWCLITRVLFKVQAQQASLVLVAPVWPTQVRFPVLVSMLVDIPILLPMIPSPNCDCPVQDTLPKLAAWKVSGRDLDRRHE